MKTNVDWQVACQALDEFGFVKIPAFLAPEECSELVALYGCDSLFRSTINMRRYRFGEGEYKYFKYPLPGIIQRIRETLYCQLAPVANGWMTRLNGAVRYPESLPDFLALCRAQNQARPTPLILRYEGGGYNTLHQDIYGEVFFPFQVVFMLSDPENDYEGGELVFVEQIPRAQSRAEVVRPALGDAVVFTTNFRPAKGARGYYRVTMKHGVSPVRRGVRYALGVIFHDAG